ncbi:MAG: folylpolyglutamate synthase/dihydrofolate synthase family protein [Candidatus Micrarchaeia archaeon]
MKEKWDLANIRALLSLLDNPQDDFSTINVTGSNGKGSVTAMIAACLTEAGYTTGSYYSPHVDGLRERIQVDGAEISRHDAAALFSAVRPHIASFNHEPLSFFEVVTAMALLHFSREKVDYAVLEAGLGGRLDATNVGKQSACVITNVSLEHTQLLGRTIASIAREKAGLLHENSALFTSEKNPSALAVFERACRRTCSKLFLVDPEIHDSSEGFFSPHYTIATSRTTYKISPRLLGPHQSVNATLAIAVCEELGLPKRAIERGISRAFIPARLELVRRRPMVLHDCAHNPAAASALAAAVRNIPHRRCITVIGVMADKDAEGILRALAPVTDIFICNQPRVERALSVSALARLARSFRPTRAVRDVRASFRTARSLAGPNDLILCTGSIYMLGELRGKNDLLVAQ